MTYNVGNLGPGMGQKDHVTYNIGNPGRGQAQKCGRIIPTLYNMFFFIPMSI
jgi:hypothetical protein